METKCTKEMIVLIRGGIENNFGVWVTLEEKVEATVRCSRQHRGRFRNGGGKNQFHMLNFL